MLPENAPYVSLIINLVHVIRFGCTRIVYTVCCCWASYIYSLPTFVSYVNC